MLKDRITAIEQEAKTELQAVKNSAELLVWETKYLGRKSELNTLLKGLKDLSAEERRVAGSLGNTVKQNLLVTFEARRRELEEKNTDWKAEAIDVTAPGVKSQVGHLHPITQIEHQIEDIFTRMGFSLALGPEVESEHYNFDTLNFPKDHPSRDMQDTFWVKTEASNGGKGKSKKTTERFVMRTHTSPVQIRYMETHKPPLRIIIPGRVFRNEATDASHEHTFHQFECLMVDLPGKVSVGTFKYVAETFFTELFGKKVAVRLRPSFFPFTEPSFEFDISCVLCDGKPARNASEASSRNDAGGGCAVCKQTGWIEIGGAGMVNQKVFEAAGYKRGAYQGFAWGFGMTRLAMMKYKIPDIRLLMSGDLRFLRQF